VYQAPMSTRPVGPARSEEKTVATSAQFLPNLSSLSTGPNAGKRPRTAPSQQPPTGPPPLPDGFPTDGYDGTLAGLWMDFVDTQEVFRFGVVFRTTNCYTTATYSDNVNDDLKLIGLMPTPRAQKAGTFNTFFELPRGPYLNPLLDALPAGDHLLYKDMTFGVRRPKESEQLDQSDANAESNFRRGFAEVWIGLQASMAGIAPRILAVALVDAKPSATGSVKEHIISVIEKGQELRNLYDRLYVPKNLDATERYNLGLQKSKALANAYERAADMKLMLSDTKPGNMVYFEDGRVCFIDFDAGFSAFVDSDTDSLCLEFINTALFLSSMECDDDYDDFNVKSGLSYDLRKRMDTVLMPHVMSMKRANTPSLCTTLLGLTRWQEKLADPWLDETQRNDAVAVARQALNNAIHYTKTNRCRHRAKPQVPPKPQVPHLFLQIARAAVGGLASGMDAPF
jgi:hypothetical protein